MTVASLLLLLLRMLLLLLLATTFGRWCWQGRPGPAARHRISFIPLGDERLVRSRVIQVTDAAPGTVVRLHHIAQLMCQACLTKEKVPSLSNILPRLCKLWRKGVTRIVARTTRIVVNS